MMAAEAALLLWPLHLYTSNGATGFWYFLCGWGASNMQAMRVRARASGRAMWREQRLPDARTYRRSSKYLRHDFMHASEYAWSKASHCLASWSCASVEQRHGMRQRELRKQQGALPSTAAALRPALSSSASEHCARQTVHAHCRLYAAQHSLKHAQKASRASKHACLDL